MFRTLQRGNALRDAPRHRSAPHRAFKSGRGASRNACDAERRTIVILRRCTATERFKIGRRASYDS
ncbi:hypothetical protein JN853_15825 [Pseudomonas syringae pv. actinidiae ICMP 9853]|nr:hypothetical protein JN853_15825 [Pseudomonas syringae pv. actinidiae ICMP 9853]